MRLLTMRNVSLFFLHMIGCSLALGFLAPREDSRHLVIEGIPQPFKTCGKSCDEGISIADKKLACTVSWLGTTYACPSNYSTQALARAVYFEMHTLSSRLGIAEPANVLLSFDQEGRPFISRTIAEYRERFYKSSWTLYTIFLLSFLSTANPSYFRRKK